MWQLGLFLAIAASFIQERSNAFSVGRVPTSIATSCGSIDERACRGRKRNRHGRHELPLLSTIGSVRLQASQQDEATTGSAQDKDVTYFSPNVPLDQSKYAYDQDDDDDQDRVEGDPAAPAHHMYSFFDEAIIYVRAGSGGQGASTYKKGVGGQNGQPDGGNGGVGGDVILVVDESLNTLAGLTNAWRPNSFGGSGAAISNDAIAKTLPQVKSFRAENGQDGARQQKNGKYGKETVIRVPPGTVVQEQVEIKDEDGNVIGEDLFELGSLSLDEQPKLVIAKGGEGGEGSGIGGRSRGVKRTRVPPQGGERKRIKLTLKIVADVALVGVPNAGKSTLLAAVTRAKPKIANYPFTTVIPNLGVWVPPENNYGGNDQTDNRQRQSGGAGSDGLVLCDVPGLIAGAAKGVGLGHAFLRHVERCHVILHLVDATSNDPVADFRMLNREIMNYGTGQLGKMPQVVVVNKLDTLEGGGEDWESGLKVRMSREELEQKLRDSMTHTRLMWMSAKNSDGVDDLMSRLAMFVKKVKSSPLEAP